MVSHPGHENSQKHEIEQIKQILIDLNIEVRINWSNSDLSFFWVLFPLIHNKPFIPGFNNVLGLTIIFHFFERQLSLKSRSYLRNRFHSIEMELFPTHVIFIEIYELQHLGAG